jgi:hypothetical protein
VFPSGVNALEAFVGTLAPDQRQAIRHLTLASRDFTKTDATQIERLSGLVSLKIIHAHIFGHEDWPSGEIFSWGRWSRALRMPVLKDVLHTAELQQEPDCKACPAGCWNLDEMYRIDLLLRSWEMGLLDCARESSLELIGGAKRVPERRRDSFYWQDLEDFDDDDEEDDDDYWDECDDSFESLKLCAGVEELRRLGLIRLCLPRDGARARDAMLFVIDGRMRVGML